MTTKRAIIHDTTMNLMVVAIIISIIILLLSFSVNAQYNSDSVSYTKKAKRALATKRVGATITLLGTATFIVGAIVYDGTMNDGIGIAMGGMAVTVIGIPIWMVGGTNHRKYTRKAQGITLRAQVTPRKAGLALTYRF